MSRFLFSRSLSSHCRNVQSPASSPSQTLISRIEEYKKRRSKGRRSNSKKDDVFVPVPESKKYLDTATMPMFLTAVGFCIFAKLLMMYDESKEQERTERKIRKAPAGQGTVRMLSREEWDQIQEVRPRTPFESKFARHNARVRTGEPLKMEDVKDWSVDMLTDALTRAEDNVLNNRSRR